MSDPVTNAEIEDVLSSIRRLVSEDSRQPARTLAKPVPIERDRLVLTPALRVSDPVEIAEVAPDPEPGPDLAPELPPELTPEQAAPWTDPEATLFQAAGQGMAEPIVDTPAEESLAAATDLDKGPTRAGWLDEAGRQAGETVDATDRPDPDDHGASDVEAADLVDDAPDTDWHAGDADRPDDADGLESDQEALEAFFDVAAAEDEEAMFAADDEADAPISEAPISEAHPSETDAEDDDPFNPVAEDADEAPLGPTVAALETAIGETPDQWEPDGAGGDEYAGTPVETLQWEDHAEVPETTPERSRDRANGPTPATGFAAMADDAGTGAMDTSDLMAEETILDEESLRELVTDIVREELQGALGERITRNVRKLVRREIHRALTAQELE